MSRRRRSAPPPKPFDQVFAGIDTLEQNVHRRTTDARFTPEQMVRWMLPADIVDKLQAAFDFVREPDRTSFWHEALVLPLVFPAVRCNFTIKVKSPEVRMLVPAPGLVETHPYQVDSFGIMEAIRHAYATHEQFEKVRKVARWLNANATVGAGRHYCPWLAGVLPEGHAFHEASGTIYREPAVSMAPIMDTMRECGAIMAGALLCGAHSEPPKDLLAVTFSGTRDVSDSYTSNAFGIL